MEKDLKILLKVFMGLVYAGITYLAIDESFTLMSERSTVDNFLGFGLSALVITIFVIFINKNIKKLKK